MDNKNKILTKYDISETVYNTGIQNFSENKLNELIGKRVIPFLETYVNDKENKIKRDENILELYYNATEFKGNFKKKPEDFIIGDDGTPTGRIEIAGVPLYEKLTNKRVGIAHWKCIENIFLDGTKYIECKLIYFLDNEFIPENVKKANSDTKVESHLGEGSIIKRRSSTIVTDFNYTSRPGLGTLFAEGDYFVSKGYYSYESGVNRSQVINNIYLPLNSSDKRRSIIVFFNKIDSNNFLPQKNYGVNTVDKMDNIDSQFNFDIKKK